MRGLMRLGHPCRSGPMLLVSVAVLLGLIGCTTSIAGSGSPSRAAVAPDATLPVVSDGKTDVDRLAKNAITDVVAFWTKQYPAISGGQPLPPLKGKVYSVDDTNPAPVDKDNACIAASGITAIKNNAFFCVLDDSIAYDRAGFIPSLVSKYGPYFVAAVFAHEFGHAIQYRLGTIRRYPSIVKETQADCAAGAFTASVLAEQAPHLRVTPSELDTVLTGYIQLRDPTGHSATDPGTHGNGFDRLSAFSAGITHGPTYCYNADWVNRPFTERTFTSDADYASGGNETLAQVLDPSPPSGNGGGGGGLQPSLNAYWTRAASSVRKTWRDVTIAEAPHPKCSASTTSEFGYCPDDNTVYYSRRIAEQAYAFGDYALGTLFTYGWGLAARQQLFGRPLGDQAALLAAGCYSGAYAQSINDPNLAGFRLSPPDMDEAATAVMTMVSADQAYGGRGTNGLQRINSFTDGYFNGLSGCTG